MINKKLLLFLFFLWGVALASILWLIIILVLNSKGLGNWNIISVLILSPLIISFTNIALILKGWKYKGLKFTTITSYFISFFIFFLSLLFPDVLWLGVGYDDIITGEYFIVNLILAVNISIYLLFLKFVTKKS